MKLNRFLALGTCAFICFVAGFGGVRAGVFVTVQNSGAHPSCSQGEFVAYGALGPECHSIAGVLAMAQSAEAQAVTQAMEAPWRDGDSRLYLTQSHDSTVNSNIIFDSSDFATRDWVDDRIAAALADLDMGGELDCIRAGIESASTEMTPSGNVHLYYRYQPDYVLTGSYSGGNYGNQTAVFCKIM